MSTEQRTHIVLGILLFCSVVLLASGCSAEKALWVDVKEKGERKTTIAMTEGIARQLLGSEELKVRFAEKGKKELITLEMLRSVLDGKGSLEARDSQHDSEVKVYLKQLSTPGSRKGRDRLVLETHEAGKKKFRIALPDIAMEKSDEESETDELVKINFGWKALLPFLAKEGGAVYINDQQKDLEVWIFVE
ncbi:MAG: hypothetical protein AAB209_00455 [Bacteroidota bacterium]